MEYSILVVDDHKIIRDMLENQLQFDRLCNKNI